MGLFSSNYYKEGPGVEKNERKKKGFFAFFEIYFRNFWGLFLISLVYSLISILGLGFTNGLAKAGFTHVARSINREKHSFLFSDFFETIKKNWKQSLILGVINILLTAILGADIYYFWGYISNVETGGFPIIQVLGLGISMALVIVMTFIKYYIWTLTITFSLNIRQMIKNSFHFVFLNLWRNIMIAVIMGAIYVGLYFLATVNGGLMVVAIILLVGVVPGFKMCLIQANVFPSIKKYIIDPYYAEHKGEDIEKRRALGLEINEDELQAQETEGEEPIFVDTVSHQSDDE